MGSGQSKPGEAQVELVDLTNLAVGDPDASFAGSPSLEIVPCEEGQVLVIAYEANDGATYEGAPRQHIRFSTSFDGGMTWTPSVAPAWGLAPCWGPALFWDASRLRLLLFYSESRKCLSRGGDVKMMISEDLGSTWSGPEVVFSHEEMGEVPKVTSNRPTMDADGALYLPIHLEPEGSHATFNASTRSELEELDATGLAPEPPPGSREQSLVTSALLLKSSDGGITWRKLPSLEDANHWVIQPSVEALGDGKLVCLLRTGAGRVYVARSADGGQTWTRPTSTSLPNPNSKVATTYLFGQLLMAHNSSTKARTPLALSISVDGGRGWTHLATIDEEEDAASPSIVLWGEDEVKVAYCVDERRLRIAFVRLEVERV